MQAEVMLKDASIEGTLSLVFTNVVFPLIGVLTLLIYPMSHLPLVYFPLPISTSHVLSHIFNFKC